MILEHRKHFLKEWRTVIAEYCLKFKMNKVIKIVITFLMNVIQILFDE